MTNGKNISQNEVAGFLLGLGIGLVVGLLSQPRSNDYSRGLIQESAKQAESRIARSRTEQMK